MKVNISYSSMCIKDLQLTRTCMFFIRGYTFPEMYVVCVIKNHKQKKVESEG